MDVAIVYESLFGNTKTVAEAIAEGVQEADPAARVDLLPVAAASDEKIIGADLLIVGGPTHIMRMSSPRSREQGVLASEKSARDKGTQVHFEPGARGPGIREFLGSLPAAKDGSRAASFDTRLTYPLAGGAAKPIGRKLRQHGYAMAGKATGFFVTGGEGPLREGERDRARAWGAALAADVASRSARTD
jgi:multimeric flavodoxin WrbA